MGAGALTFTYGMKTTQREREIMVNYTLNISHNAFIGAMKDQELPPSAYSIFLMSMHRWEEAM